METATNNSLPKKDLEKAKHSRKIGYNKFKGRKFTFRGETKSSSRYSDSKIQMKRNYLYSVTEKGCMVSALSYSVPRALRPIHAYHADRLKLIEWIAKANLKATGQYSNRKLQLYKRQKGLCTVCHTLIEEQDFNDDMLHIHHVIPISKGGSPKRISNMAVVHKECHLSINH